MTADELEKQIDRAMKAFMEIEGMTEELAQRLVEQGYLSYDDLSVIEPDALMELGGLTEEQVDAIVAQADDKAAENQVAENERKKLEKAEKERLATEAILEAERAENSKKKSDDEEPAQPPSVEPDKSSDPNVGDSSES
jgi:N utilization substance protein A